MSIGVVMLVHTALDRAEQVARFWAAGGCPVVIHVDATVPGATVARFRTALADVPLVRFCKRYRCEWGTWGMVAATKEAARLLLRDPAVDHVYLSSGACLPLRPVADLQAYLAARPGVDFIESAATTDVPWTVDGLDRERFTLFFPVSWKRHRMLFDAGVAVQRRLGVRRAMPRGLVPHMGSQWWCLTRATLQAILTSPHRRAFDRYFRRVWIPDESYFQSLARLYSGKVESRSLTLSKFDFQGKPHIFYDDHLQLLRRSDCFVARKIWPHADRLYDAFLGPPSASAFRQDPMPGKIDRIFAKAVERRTRGRAGLYMQSRFPNSGWENGMTAAPYAVLHGFAPLFEDFSAWLARTTASRVHGHLFAPDRVHFAQDEAVWTGALTDNPRVRDANPKAFLTNLIWNTRGERQSFLYGPEDTPGVIRDIAGDANAVVCVVTGAWTLPLSQADKPFTLIRAQAAAMQRAEAAMLDTLRGPRVKARVQIWSMADLVEAPAEVLEAAVTAIGRAHPDAAFETPALRDLAGLPAFLQKLKNAGMHPYLTGDVAAHLTRAEATPQPPRRYVAE